MGDGINLPIKDSCPYFPREKREECWKGTLCDEISIDILGGASCYKVRMEFCSATMPLKLGDELSIIKNAYGPLSSDEIKEVLQTRDEIWLDGLLSRLSYEIEKTFSKEDVHI